MTCKLALIFFLPSFFGIAVPVFAAEGTQQQVQATHTERMSFAPGGIIRVNNSYGDLKVEGWDRPEVEITVLKSTTDYYEPQRREEAAQRLERVSVVTERRSDSELVISTMLPSRGGFFHPPLPRTTKAGVTVECLIHAPRDTRLTIHHGVGYVLVSNMTADVEATAGRGDIVLMLPDSGTYSIDAKTKMGKVSSDYAGTSLNRFLVGQRFSGASPSASHRLYLRMGFGGITIKPVPAEAIGPVVANTK